MKSHIHQRLKTLTATIASRRSRSYTLEGLCWEYWQQDKRGFIALANGECPYLRVFVDSFRPKDGEFLTAKIATDITS
jgi:hypothetical protein